VHYIDINRIAKQIVFALLLRLILEVIQIAIAVGNYVVAVMVAHCSVSK
jgi:hypothetical protein